MASRAMPMVVRLAAYLCRVGAWVLSAMVVLLSLGTAASLGLVGFAMGLNDLVPEAISGQLVVPTPFGGAFRGDFFLMALGLFIIDWLLCRLSASLRG